MDENIAKADIFLASAELYLYGGLIALVHWFRKLPLIFSVLEVVMTVKRYPNMVLYSNNSTVQLIVDRLQKIVAYKEKYPQLQIYLSTVVMRIPAYNGDFEEPWFE